MKRMIISGLLVFAALSTISCNREKEMPVSSQGREMIITAAREDAGPDTRTMVAADGRVLWSPEDHIDVVYSANTTVCEFVGQNADSAETAQFKGTIDDSKPGFLYYGLYPHAADNAVSEEGIVTMTLRPAQKAVGESFENNLFPTIACSANHELFCQT